MVGRDAIRSDQCQESVSLFRRTIIQSDLQHIGGETQEPHSVVQYANRERTNRVSYNI